MSIYAELPEEMTTIETIRAEIERRTYNAHEMPDSRPDKQFYEGKDVAYGEILAFLDTLKEKPTWVSRAGQRQKDKAAGKKIAIMEIRAEIERRRRGEPRFLSDFEWGCTEGNNQLVDELLDFLDTLEAEERGKEPATIAFERLHGLNSKK